MLIKDFYNQIICNQEDNIIIFSIKLNPNHKVYKGHFPQQAVVPGVIQLQIAKELLEENLKLNLLMNDIIQVKYLKPIIPDQDTIIKFEITIKEQNASDIKTNVNIGSEDIIFTKAKISFKINN
jgi:3-hydroxyacyl-[acyl-carrier-protein] dehydratase